MKLKDGSAVEAATVGTLLREQLQLWTVEATAKVTGLAPEVIETFADGFAKAERRWFSRAGAPTVFVHSDLMNRTKLLCLSLKGAFGKKGAGYQATAFVDLTGFPALIQSKRVGLRGKIEMLTNIGSPSEVINLIVDGVKKRRSEIDITMGLVREGEGKTVCSTGPGDHWILPPGHQRRPQPRDEGRVPALARQLLRGVDREGLAERPSRERSAHARTSAEAPICFVARTIPETMLEEMWPKLKVAVSLDQKMCFTGMHSDYYLPAAGYYEKSGIKYPMAYAPYLHYCDAAVPPLGESKDEWEVYWLLTKEMERIAQERNLEPFTDCGEEPIDYKELNKIFSFQGRFGPKDAEGVSAAIIDASPAAGGVTIAELKKKGIHRFVSAGDSIAPTAIYNTDWNGEGVLNPFTYFTKHKWRWPTQTGRQQYYIDQSLVRRSRRKLADAS